MGDNQMSNIQWERHMAYHVLRTPCVAISRPTAQAIWWVLAATEARIAPVALARRLDTYVARGADRAEVWAAVAEQLRWSRNTRLIWRG